MSQPPVPERPDSEATIMIPRPGGQRRAAPPQAAPGEETQLLAPPASGAAAPGANPLLALAAPLLDAVPTIRGTLSHQNPPALRERLLQAISEFEDAARRANLVPEHVLVARYALCTVLDEAVAEMPWGESAGWSRQSLLVSLHRETWGGEKFFLLLDKMLEQPRRNLDLLELLYACLALGFQGRYRVLDNGRAQLDALRERLHETIRRERGNFEPDLAGRWHGVPRAQRPLARRLSHWLVLGALATVLLGLYMSLSLLLAGASDPVFAALGQLRVPRSAVERTAPAPAPVAAAVAPRLRPLLQAEIAQGLLDVVEDAGSARVVLAGDSFYEPGHADVRPGLLPVLARIADAMNQVPGAVSVVGHTDDRPMRSLRFPSNYELSLQRAQEVGQALGERLHERARLRVEGRAESQPVASNDTPEGRARNRRVEITLRYAS